MRNRLLLFVVLLVVVVTCTVFAQLSPGKLSKYHSSMEGLNNCTQCHELGEDVSNAKCLACHAAIQTRISGSKGYHASADVQGKSCATCHSDHHGLDYEMVFWKDGKDKFDHRKTGWPLEGAHAKQGCRSCHIAGLIQAADVLSAKNLDSLRTYLGLGTACVDCHRDEHGDQLTNECLSCHTQNSWIPAEKFSHANARYPLTGKHVSTECIKCHRVEDVTISTASSKIDKKERVGQSAVYAGLTFSQCSDCHRDVHEGKFGAACASCHTTDDFKSVAVAPGFDHSQTGYPLLGMHKQVACLKCHTGKSMTDPVAHEQCLNCHRDEHHGQFKDRADQGKCESCHTVEGFVPAHFSIEDHNLSRFALTGSHLAIPCMLCHAQTGTAPNQFAKFDFKGTTCKDCHEDVHRGQLDKYIKDGGCESCHNTATWHSVTFDHSKTKFPLVGKHETTACIKCHIHENVGTLHESIRMTSLSTTCSDCHDEPHQAQFAVDGVTNCAACHTPASWIQLTFDHNRSARFVLDGAHATVACNQCHVPQIVNGKSFVRYKPLGVECVDCHSRN